MQMADPLTALMYAVQVMNFLKMLILRTLKEREESILEAALICHSGPSDENGHYNPKFHVEACKEVATEQTFVREEPTLDGPTQTEDSSTRNHATDTCQTSQENDLFVSGPTTIQSKFRRKKSSNPKKGTRRSNGQSVRSTFQDEKSRGISIVNLMNSRAEQVKAWR